MVFHVIFRRPRHGPGETTLRRIDSVGDIEDGLTALAQCDGRLARAIELAGPVPLRRKPPGFAALAEIILSQMVSKASADALWRKLEAAAGEMSPDALLKLSPEALRAAGLSQAKAGTLVRVGSAVMEGKLDLDHLCRVEGREAMNIMTAIKGVGPWTAEVYLLFCAGHPDIFPSGDVALQNAAAHVLGLSERPPAKKLTSLAQPWSPWRGVAARLLWAYYSTVLRREATPLGA
jgi:DNA-3-methyladenine glycosylase II